MDEMDNGRDGRNGRNGLDGPYGQLTVSINSSFDQAESLVYKSPRHRPG